MSPEMHITIQIIRQYRMWPKDTPLTFAGGVSRQIDVGGRGCLSDSGIVAAANRCPRRSYSLTSQLSVSSGLAFQVSDPESDRTIYV